MAAPKGVRVPTAIQRIRDRLTKNQIARNTDDSRQWLYKNVRRLVPAVRTHEFTKGSDRLTTKPLPGHMYMYLYDPKHKLTLKYYDRFPLVFVIKYYPDGFLGLNLHYLQPIYRMKLYEALLQYASNENYDERTKMRLTWRKLMAFGRSEMAQACTKRYLYAQLDSKFVLVPSDEWELTLFLPSERFKTVNKSIDRKKVWADTAKKVR